MRRVLRDCGDHLGEIFTTIFNKSLNQAVLPCLQSSINVPLTKKNISGLNDYRTETHIHEVL